MADTIDWPPQRRPRYRGRLALLVIAGAILLGGSTALSYYVEALWFDSLGFAAVFWKTLNLEAVVFAIFAALTFVALYGGYFALKPARLADLAGGAIVINGQPLRLPVEPVIRLIALVLAIVIALISGAGMMAEWSSLALYWSSSAAMPAGAPASIDPIFGRSLNFYLFTLPAWEL